ncbi:Hypothetical protein SRAE_0000053000 [Strongyloides ratti]|uniref:Uncharacterized protein n=1 Tax=Strongyloides ratti TaxID=34506 RepID=A0A090KVF3_STRRB|nr:Hypothetical protein SRAE_0000053000 [Strongyloides ratti]CEF61406.1 Hypothetical protein SRAE_0000053000 [Strongyloides ratti]
MPEKKTVSKEDENDSEQVKSNVTSYGKNYPNRKENEWKKFGIAEFKNYFRDKEKLSNFKKNIFTAFEKKFNLNEKAVKMK